MSNKDVENHNFIQIVYNTEALNENKIKILANYLFQKTKKNVKFYIKIKFIN